MKILAVSLIALCAVFSLSAVIRTVDQNSPSVGQYNNWTAAYTASADGDTIYLYPTTTTYGDFYLQKRLTVIGGGLNPANPSLPTSKITLHTYYASAIGCKLIGLDFPNPVYCYYQTAFNNCRFNAAGNYIIRSNSAFTDCIFKNYIQIGDGSNETGNIVISGCTFDFDGSYQSIIYGYTTISYNNCLFIGNNNHFYPGGTPSTVNVLNCVFVNRGTGAHNLFYYTSNTNGYAFTNCIFESMSNFQANATFQYCILEQSFTYVDPTNMQNVNMATVMVDVNGGNYHLVPEPPDNPAVGAGLGGVVIGLYGGPSPFDDLWYLTFLPSITDFDCPPIVNASGQLNVHVEAQCGN